MKHSKKGAEYLADELIPQVVSEIGADPHSVTVRLRADREVRIVQREFLAGESFQFDSKHLRFFRQNMHVFVADVEFLSNVPYTNVPRHSVRQENTDRSSMDSF